MSLSISMQSAPTSSLIILPAAATAAVVSTRTGNESPIGFCTSSAAFKSKEENRNISNTNIINNSICFSNNSINSSPLIILSSPQLSTYAAVEPSDSYAKEAQQPIEIISLADSSQSLVGKTEAKSVKKAKQSPSSQSIRRLVSIRPHPISLESSLDSRLSSDVSCKLTDSATYSFSHPNPPKSSQSNNIRATNEPFRCRKRKKSLKLSALIEEKANLTNLEKNTSSISACLASSELKAKDEHQQRQQKRQQTKIKKVNDKKYSSIRIKSIRLNLNENKSEFQENDGLISYCSPRKYKFKLADWPSKGVLSSLSSTSDLLKTTEKSESSNSLFGKYLNQAFFSLSLSFSISVSFSLFFLCKSI
jgi:hypothetical protein